MDRTRPARGTQMSRGDFLKLSGVGLTGAALLGTSGCGIFGGNDGQGDGGSQQLVFTDSGGSLQEAIRTAWLDPYEEETGAEVISQAPSDPAKLRAMVEADNVSWDVIATSEVNFLSEMGEYFEPLDYSVIGADGVPEQCRYERQICYIEWGMVLGYNEDRVDQAPESWVDYFDIEGFPGNRSISAFVLDYPLEMALVADGVEPENLYPIDIDRALAKLDTIRDNLVFYDTGQSMQQQLADGEVAMSLALNGRAQSAINDGFPVSITWNQYLAKRDVLAIPKGAPNKEAAMKVIAYIMSAENNWKLSQNIAYAPTNANSVDSIPEDVAQTLPTYEDRQESAVNADLDWYSENLASAQERYKQWQIS